MAFLDDYEPVADRLARFWKDHPDGRIHTVIERMADGVIIMRAEVYRDAGDPHPAATGYAEETRTERGVNATSFVENAETSAVGRALANLNYAPKAARPSREEMAKTQRAEQDGWDAVKPALPDQIAMFEAQLAEIKAAETPERLTVIATAVKGNVAAGRITKMQYDKLVRAGAHRRGELDKAATP